MADTLNPEALKLYRKQRGWSQDRLASESKISKTQISRWERGEQVAGIRQSSRDRLRQALGVNWEQLTRAPKEEDTLKWRNRVPLKGGIDGSARTFLTLVQSHFGVTEDAIIDLAPLAVLILGRRSLCARRAALDETVAALDAAAAEACRRLPYMPGAIRNGYDYEWIDEERNSLKEKELFMTHGDDEGNEYSPFIQFLRDELDALELFQKQPIEFTVSYRGATPDYAVPTHVLGANVGLDPDNEADQGILERIQDGRIDLKEVWEKKQNTGEEEYRRWLEERYQAINEEMEAQRERMISSIRSIIKIKLPQDQSQPSVTSSTANQGTDIDNTDSEQRT
jgi:transcriptional regulator with XRE-family HTH domain